MLASTGQQRLAGRLRLALNFSSKYRVVGA
jgi:hypothetical protein